MAGEISSILFEEWEDDVINSQANKLETTALCCDEEIKGFDKNMGTTWIYPTNYPVRDYQFNIVQSALFNNTLVSLPTGLGKTFIAAVVMYNFYRWYPQGKIIFTAPTRPLVAQQIEACYNIMAIPPGDTIEMTGSMQTANRKTAWQEKRVFYATPQVIQNDLESGSCPAESIRCVVIDEAHRAKGKHSYCQLMDTLSLKQHRVFRVLALSATPGGKVDDVINVVKNLHISHLELRSETSLDVANFTHSKKIETVEIKLGDELTKIRQDYIEIIDTYTRRLVQYNILTGNIGNFSKGRIIMLFKEYQAKEKASRHPQHKYIMHDFTMVITLYHALELLTKHGSRVFLKFFEEHTDKTWVGKDTKLTSFLENLKTSHGVNPFSIDRSPLPNGSIPEIKVKLNYGHPKFDKLKEIVMTHFNESHSRKQETKAIVFCEYRESVNLVHCLLLQCRPLVKPQMFIGQGAGSSKDSGMSPFSQKKQLHIMRLFREGLCNVLVSTCVGEEGLDIGSVDLIICFDISTKSPVRLIQRCGRTGRERGGKVFILVTEGREHQTLKDCIYQRDNLNKKILNSKELRNNLYSANPRMIPSHIKPSCQKMFITVKKENLNAMSANGQRKIKDMFGRKVTFDSDDDFKRSNESPILSEDEYKRLYPSGDSPNSELLPDNNTVLCALTKKDGKGAKYDKLSNWLEWQRNLQYTSIVGHSKDSEILCELLTFAEMKKFNLPHLTQTKASSSDSTSTQKKTTSVTNTDKKNLNIKDMFMKITKKNKGPDSIFDIKMKEIMSNLGIDYDGDKNVIDAVCQKYKVETEFLDLFAELKVDETMHVPNRESRFQNNVFDKSNNNCITRHVSELGVKKLNLSLNTIDQLMSFDFSSIDTNLTNLQTKQLNLNKKSLSVEKNTDVINLIEDDSDFFKLENLDFSSLESNVQTKIDVPPSINDGGLDFFGLNDLEDLFEEDSSNSNDCPRSPILCSQRPSKKISLSSNTTQFDKPKPAKLSPIIEPVEPEVKDQSMFTVTQIMDIIDQNYDSPSPNEIHDITSPILTQTQRRKNYRKSDEPSTSISIVLETSESSQSEDESNFRTPSVTKPQENNNFKSPNVSPFFNGHNKSTSPSVIRRKPLTIKDKLNKNLASQSTRNVSETSPRNISLLSQFAKPEKAKLNSGLSQEQIESDDDFESILKMLPSPRKSDDIEQRKPTRKKVKKKKRCEFIEYEAELSSDSYDSSENENCDSSNSQLVDTSLVEFICDEDDVPVCNESIDMQAKYLQSVKSPIKTAGQFKMPLAVNKTVDVFSQFDPDHNLTYELDSFCVGPNEGLTQQHDMSELEIAEALLRKRRKRKRKKPLQSLSPKPPPKIFNPANDSPIAANKKKRRLRIDSDSDSDDNFM